MSILDNEGHDPNGIGNRRASEREVLCACTDSCSKDAEIERLNKIVEIGTQNHRDMAAGINMLRLTMENALGGLAELPSGETLPTMVHECEAMAEAIARYGRGRFEETERVRAAFDVFSKAVSAPGGPSLAMQQHEPTWEAWRLLCAAIKQRASY